MKHIPVIILLLVVGATAWGMTRVVYSAGVSSTSLSLRTHDRAPRQDDFWRRTANGWERLPLGRETASDFQPRLHPAVVAMGQLFAGLFGLLAPTCLSRA